LSFLKLYQFAEQKAQTVLLEGDPARVPVELKDVQAEIIDIGMVAEIEIEAVELDQSISKGHIVIEDLRASMHDDEYLVAKIRIDRELNRCWARYVACKELMHVFDSAAQAVPGPDHYRALMAEVDSPRMAGDVSQMYDSEFGAMWMALLVLCPLEARNEFKARLDGGEVTPFDVALRFRIPEAIIVGLMGDYYERAYHIFIGEPLRIAELEAIEIDPNELPPGTA
jgi:hypothetical protein